jgi:hypothetical protein
MIERADYELSLLYLDLRGFAREYNGRRPVISPLLKIPEGFVVNGDLPQDQLTGAIAVFFRPESGGSVSARKAQLQVAESEEILGSDLLFVTVKVREGGDYPYDWDLGPVLQKDLTRDRNILREEAITAERGGNTSMAGAKLRAILIQTPWSQRHLTPSWREIFIDPHIQSPLTSCQQPGEETAEISSR